MKKIVHIIIAVVGWLGFMSCSDEHEAAISSDEVAVSFSVKVAEGIETKATLSDGTKAKNLVVGVFEKVGEELKEIPALRYQKDGAFDGSLKADVTFHLVKGKEYGFIFWAQQGSVTGSLTALPNPCYNLQDLRSIRVDYVNATVVSNDENRDAFLGVEQPRVITGDFTQEVTLKRPFAQLNFLVTQAEFDAANKSTNVDLKQSQVTISNVATTLHPFTNTVDNFQEVTFKPGAIPLIDDRSNQQTHPNVEGTGTTGYCYLATNYFLVAATGEGNNPAMQRATVPSVNLRLADANGNLMEGEGLTVPNVPVQWNYRTNIYGNLLTANSQFKVEITPNFTNNDHDVQQPQTQMVATVADVPTAIQTGKTNIVVQNAPTADAVIAIPKTFGEENTTKIELTLPDTDKKITIKEGDGNLKTPTAVHVTIPDATDLEINLPDATVTVNGVYQNVSAITAENTLILAEDASITDLHVNKGNVEIYGKVTGTINLAEGNAIKIWAVSDNDELKQAIENKAETIRLRAGKFKLPASVSAYNETITFEGAGVEKSKIVQNTNPADQANNYTFSVPDAVVTFKNLSIDRPRVNNNGGYVQAKEEHFDNCFFTGCYVPKVSVVSAKNTKFSQQNSSHYGICIDANCNFSFEKCTFNDARLCMEVNPDWAGELKIINCSFTAYDGQTQKEGSTAIDLKTKEKDSYGTLTVTNTTVKGFDSTLHDGLWQEVDKASGESTNLVTKIVDGRKFIDEGVWQPVGQTAIYEIDNAQGVLWFRKQAATILDFFQSKTIRLTADIDMNDLLPEGAAEGTENWTAYNAGRNLLGATFDGNHHVISNLFMRSKNYGCGFISGVHGYMTIKNIKFDKADVSYSCPTGVVIGWQQPFGDQALLFENVEVTNSKVSCSGDNAVGSIIGVSNNVRFKNCRAVGNSLHAQHHAGGLSGMVYHNSASQPNPNIVLNCTVENTFVRDPNSKYETLDTKINEHREGQAYFPGLGYPIKGLYRLSREVYTAAYGEYYTSGLNLSSPPTPCPLEDLEGKLNNYEIVVNKDWVPVNNQ